MEVRPARVGDAAAIADVHVRTWQAAYDHVFGAEALAAIDARQRRTWWEQSVADQREIVLVAESEGRVTAFASLGPCRDPDAEGELYAIYSLPEAWGSGAGPALMRAGLDALREAGYADAILWVLEDNPRARRFYEREGWMLDGARREGEHLGVRTVEVRYRIML